MTHGRHRRPWTREREARAAVWGVAIACVVMLGCAAWVFALWLGTR